MWYHGDVFFDFPPVNPKKKKEWRYYDHLLPLVAFVKGLVSHTLTCLYLVILLLSVYDLVLDFKLVDGYLYGWTYTKTEIGTSHENCTQGGLTSNLYEIS